MGGTALVPTLALAGNLAADGEDCLVVASGDVSIDGAGFAVGTGGTDAGDAVVIAPEDVGNVAVHDLHARNARFSFRIEGAEGATYYFLTRPV